MFKKKHYHPQNYLNDYTTNSTSSVFLYMLYFSVCFHMFQSIAAHIFFKFKDNEMWLESCTVLNNAQRTDIHVKCDLKYSSYLFIYLIL